MTARRYLLIGFALALVANGAGKGRGDIFGPKLTDAQQVIADTKINHGDMTIAATTVPPDTAVDPGQPITLSVTVSKNAHVAILRVMPNGSTSIVFPNKARPKSDVAANTKLTVPAPGDGVKISADKPGLVLFEIMASSASDSWLFTRAPAKDQDFAELGVTTRLIAKDLTSTLKVGKGPETVATYVTVRVRGGGLF